MVIKNPNNPLYGRENRRGRGYTRYNYTLEDISRVANRVIGTVRNDVSRGVFEPWNFESVIKYVRGRG